jgi:glycosyltransferase involved in cell wall biosynthesis
MKRICIVDPVFTRYGLPVIRELSCSCQVDWVFSRATAKSGFGPPPSPGTDNLRYVELPTFKPFGDKMGMFHAGLGKYVLRERPDAIKFCANPRYLSFWTTLFLARILGIPFYAHGVGFFKRRRIGFGRQLMMRLMLRLVTSYIAYAPVVRDAFAAHGFSLAKISVVHNSLVNPFPVSPGEKTGQERGILFVGRLRPRSGLEMLVRVLRRLHQEGRFPFRLHVIGIGEEGEKLKQDAEGCEWIVWHGNASDQAASAISRDCLFGCYPGNAGLSVVHMMSLSLPVLTHDDLASHEGPEPSFVRDGISGILFDHRSPEESLYQALHKAATNPGDIACMRFGAYQEYQSLVSPSFATRLWSILNDGAIKPDNKTLSAVHM